MEEDSIVIHDMKKDLNELFDRVRMIETHQAVSAERDKTLLEKMEDLTKFFKEHDVAEMKKYDTIELEVAKLSKLVYVVSGVGMLLGYIGLDNLKILLGG